MTATSSNLPTQKYSGNDTGVIDVTPVVEAQPVAQKATPKAAPSSSALARTPQPSAAGAFEREAREDARAGGRR